MLKGSRGVVVAVSGGPDSVALLDMLLTVVRGQGSIGAGCADAPRGVREKLAADPRSPTPCSYLHVAHLDHMLRGRDSDADAEFVRALAAKSGLPVTVARVDTRAEAESARRGIEEVARELRYNFLLNTAQQNGCDRIATGHTMTDQAETFLMRLARGAGLRGLAAMRPVSKAHAFKRMKDEGGRMKEEKDSFSSVLHPSSFILHPLLIRPLLDVTREEVEQFCRERGLEYRIDETNLSPDYTRNRVRNLVLPALGQINRQAVESIARAALIAAEDEDALTALASSLLDQAETRGRIGGDGFAYRVAALIGQPVALRRRMVIEALRRLRGRAGDSRGRARGEIGSKHITAVLGLLEDGASGRRVELPAGREVWREFDLLVFKAGDETGRATREGVFGQEISAERPLIEAFGFKISLLRGKPVGQSCSMLEQERPDASFSRRDWMVAVLDDQRLPARLVVRKRRAGERAQVLGQRQTKKLKNLMIDHKIPTSRRAIWPVVATLDGLYVWSPGLPPAVQFAARDETQGLAILRASVI
jgi:tRNA(Ile)-lysidine synthetase-like protein